MENHEEILVDLQGYGSGIGMWGSVGGRRPKISARRSQRRNGPSRSNRRPSRGNKKSKKPYVEEEDEEAAEDDESTSSSRRSENGGEEEDEEEDAEDAGERGRVSSRNAPARKSANASRPGPSILRQPDASSAPPRPAMKGTKTARVVEPQVSRRETPLVPGPESPETTKKEKPRYRFRRGIKAYLNEFLEYKVDELVDYKVEERLAFERSREQSMAPASGPVNRSIKFSEDAKSGLPEPGKRSIYKPRNQLSVPTVAQPSLPKASQPGRPRASRVRPASPYRVRLREPPPALYRAKSSGRANATSGAKSGVAEGVNDGPTMGPPDAKERGGVEDEWVDDVDEEDIINDYLDYKGEPINGDAEEAGEDARSTTADDGFPDEDAGVYKNNRPTACIRDFGQGPDAAAFTVLHATVEEDVTSDDASVDAAKLVRDLWPKLGPRRPLNKRHGFVDVRTV